MIGQRQPLNQSDTAICIRQDPGIWAKRRGLRYSRNGRRILRSAKMSRVRRNTPEVSERDAILKFLHDIEPEVMAVDAVAGYLLNVCIKRIARPPSQDGLGDAAVVGERPSKGRRL
jgi:hypothetical protein